jgi:DnaJ-class molecular chaperone
MMNNTDYYADLGIDPASPPEEIARAYRRLARQYHPDLNPYDADAVRCFQEINEAYQVLSDPEKRAQYDLQRASSLSPSSDEQPVSYQRTVEVQLENAGDLSAVMEQLAKGLASEVQGVLRDFGAELNAMSRSFHAAARAQQGRHQFSPPPHNGRPPRNGRPPWNGKAPKS